MSIKVSLLVSSLCLTTLLSVTVSAPWFPANEVAPLQKASETCRCYRAVYFYTNLHVTVTEIQRRLLQSWWRMSGTNYGMCWRLARGNGWWTRRRAHTHTHTHTHTHIRHSSSLCAFFFLINHGYWCTECWKAESINKRKSFLRGEWLKGRVYPHAVHLSTCACVSACVRLSVCAVCCIHVSNLHISPSSEVSFASCPFVSALLSPDSQSWLVNV